MRLPGIFQVCAGIGQGARLDEGAGQDAERAARAGPGTGARSAIETARAASIASLAVTPGYRWLLDEEPPGGSAEFPALVGGSAQVFLAAPYMILRRLIRS
jgi:hypothetical protein